METTLFLAGAATWPSKLSFIRIYIIVPEHKLIEYNMQLILWRQLLMHRRDGVPDRPRACRNITDYSAHEGSYKYAF